MITAHHIVRCDTPECLAIEDAHELTKSGAWRVAKVVGWRRIAGKHLCPKCVKRATRAT